MLPALFLIIISPYTAFLPLIYLTFKWIVQKKSIKWSLSKTSLLLLFFVSITAALANKSVSSFIGSIGLFFFVGSAFYLQQTITEEGQIRKLLLCLWPLTVLTGIYGIMQKVLSYPAVKDWLTSQYPTFLDRGIYTISISYAQDKIWVLNPLPSLVHGGGYYRIQSTFLQSNVAGTWFAFMVLVSIYLWEAEKIKSKRYLAGVGLFSIALVFTGSRGAMMGMLVSLAVYGLLTRNSSLKKLLLAIFCGLLIAAYYEPRLVNILDSLGIRTEIWANSLPYIEERFITGWGISGAVENLGYAHSHNVWISMLFFFGIPGLLAYMLWRGSLYKGLFRLYTNGSNLAVFLISVQVFFAIHEMVDVTMMLPQSGALFFGLCGVTAGLIQRTPETAESIEDRMMKEDIG